MDNNKKAINKLELLLRAMAKAQGVDPDRPNQDDQPNKQIINDENN